MKIQLKYLLAILVVIVLSSCEDATHITEPGDITPDVAFENVNDLELGLNSAYAAYGQSNVILFNAVFSDNVKKGASNNGQYQSLYGFDLRPSTDVGIWSSRYAGINFANRVLEAYNALTYDNANNRAKADNIAGQMLALRALEHFDLLEYYGESYTDDSALGIPYIDFVPKNVSIQPTRNTVGEVYQNINADLDKALSLIDNNNGVFYIGKDAIKAIRARVKLFHGKYAEAETLATQLLADHPLVDPQTYFNIFKDETEDGVIWSLARGQGESEIASIFYFNSVDINGDPIVEVSNGLYDILENGDIRKNVLVTGDSQIVAPDSPDNTILINKYPGSVSALVNDIKIFRSGEMILIKAEAQARQGNLGGAEASVKALLDARFGSDQDAPSYGSKNDALKDILKQRRIELAYEGHRFLDIKRFRDVTNKGITRNPVDCASFNAQNCDLPKDDHRFVLPIPQEELNGNKAIQQNPGY